MRRPARPAILKAVTSELVTMALRFLIVDDNPRFLEALRGLLEREGGQVVGVASTSAQALRLAEELRPDVTLVDITLGEESGFDLALRLDAATHTLVVFISSYAAPEFADLVAVSPAIGFISKADLSTRAITELLGDSGDRGTVHGG
jgi:DNA-binding NarL/FixJ family response regulator